jgi:UDP-N-acetylmuramyl pentapeptide synthase
MTKKSIPALIVLLLSLLIAVGSQTFLGACVHEDGSFGACHWAARAVLALGAAQAVLALGPNARYVAEGALAGGMDDSAVAVFDDRSAMAEHLKIIVRSGDVLLFKGSHGMHLELVLAQFLK